MGHIKEPKGIDFVVTPQSSPDKDADESVSEFIRKDKLQKKVHRRKKLVPITK